MKNVILLRTVSVILFSVSLAGTGVAQSDLARTVDSLFVIASSGEVKYQDMRDPAMDSIAAFGAEAVPLLIDKFTTKSARDRWTIIWILQRIGSPAVPDLVQALNRPDGLVVQRVCWALGDIKDSGAVQGLLRVRNHQRWQVRDQVLQALGKIGDVRGAEAVMVGFSDSIGQVRKSSVVAAGQLQLNETAAHLVHALGDEFYGARLMAEVSLLRLDSTIVTTVLADSLSSADNWVGNLGCRVLGRIGSDEAIRLLMEQVGSDDPRRRAHAAVALVEADPIDNCGFRETYYGLETDRLARLKIEAAIGHYANETGSPE